MLVAARSWYRNFDSCEPIVGQSLPKYCVDGQKEQKERVWKSEGAVISQGAWAAYHEPVVAIPVKVATLGVIGTNDLHALEDPQPTQRPALPADVAAQWHL